MPSVLTRYILRRWTTPFLGGLFFYGFLLVSWEMVAISKEIFSQGAPLRWMFPLLLLSLPETFSMVLPMAAVLGGLLGTQQLMEGSELVAAQGLGAGRRTWFSPWVILACGLLLLASVNAHLLVPASANLQQTLRRKMSEAAKARFLRPGSPPWHPPGSPDTAFWVSESGQIHLMESTAQGTQHMTASKMTYALENTSVGNAEIRLHLSDLQGVLYQPSGDGSVIHLKQEQQILRFAIPSGPRLLTPVPLRYESSKALFQTYGDARIPELQRQQSAIELSRRITLPLAGVSLLLMGIALGFGHPRFYRGGAVIKSLGVILVYYLLMKYIENMLLGGKVKSIYPTLILPFFFLGAGWFILSYRLKPHRTRPGLGGLALRSLGHTLHLGPLHARMAAAKSSMLQWVHGQGTRHGIFRHWSTLAWWRNWGLTLGSLLALDLLIEFSNLAGDLSKNNIHLVVFIKYWIWNLPPFLEVAFPVSFLLGSMLTLSEAALNREWLAIRAGGVSLLQWIWASRFAWGTVALATFLLQAGLAPMARTQARRLYYQILQRPQGAASTAPWMYLGSTGVLWHLSPEVRWGFPLKSPGEAPILLRWQPGTERSEALAWGGAHLVAGPATEVLFPDRALRDAPSASEAQTLDLVEWQRWAPDPERSYLLWSRLLGWLAGPLLVLAMLSYAFPGPRQGRGQAIGVGLVGGLVFLGLQTLFGGAARASEIPAYWGILAPFLLLGGSALARVSKLRT
ncbi:LptF/LptG family permease [Geothrix fuzhouensis]|uniref:LptF/LptG family permease n=1 Tax=Geothrix fuzhouensis TaxID=2966451 RepID=UPI0021483D9B